jgi:hypothetical protein
MRFADAGLMLGAGTVLAPSGPSGRDLSIEGHEPRLLALLAAAHLCLPAVGALNHLRKAAQRWTEGEEDLAAIHLALSRLERLKRPEIDAHRLFLADGLLQAGFEAGAILKALNVDGSGIESFAKYRPDQPRVPAGSGRPSGQWTTEGGAPTAAPAAAQRRRRPVGI